MSRSQNLSWTRKVLKIIVIAVFVGNISGLVTTTWTVFENEYLGQGMNHLAARTIASKTLEWTLWGAVWGMAAAVAVAIASRLRARLIDRKRGWLIGAGAAVLILVLYLSGSWYLNRFYFTSFFVLPSIVTNICLILSAVVLWYAFMALSNPAPKTTLPRGLIWIQGWAPAVIVLITLVSTQGAALLIGPSINGPRTNVLVLLVDAFRLDRLGAYGYHRPTSPNIDELLGDGWIFTQAVAPASWTKPSIASLFTSLYPSQHGIDSGDWGRMDDKGGTRVDVLLPALTTLAEVMANAGYKTVALGRNVHLIPRFGFAQGFDTYEMGLKDEYSTSSREIHSRFFDWLDDNEDGFFAYFHYIDIHWPYLSPPPFAGLYSGSSSPSVDYNSREIIHKAQHGEIQLKDEDVTHMSDAYDEQIQFLDTEIGKLFNELKSRGLYDETLIILTSDHGEEFLEHGHFTHSTSLYDVLLRIPLIIKFPCPGSNCYQRKLDEQVELIDIMPTILGQVGLSVSQGMQGTDLTAQNQDKSNVAFSSRADYVALRTTEFKYIYSPIDQSEELYDLQADPGETRNIAPEYPELTTSFQAQLLDWMATSKPGRDFKRREVVLDKKTLKELRSLGYIK